MPADFIALLVMLSSIIGTPGPNNTVLFTSGLDRGYRRTLPLLLSINAGVTSIVFLATIGALYISQWIPLIGDYLDWVAFIFLCYMAYSMWPKKAALTSSNRADNQYLPALQMFFFQFVNPKIWVIAIGIISSFHNSLDAFTICLLTLLVGLTLNSIWVAMGTAVKTLSKGSENIISKLGAVLMLLTAVYFVVS